HGELVFNKVRHSQYPPTLHRMRTPTMYPEFLTITVRCLCESFFYVSVLKIKCRSHVMFQGLVYARRIWGKCITTIRNHWQWLKINVYQFSCILSSIAVFRYHNRNRLADIANLTIGQDGPIYIQ